MLYCTDVGVDDFCQTLISTRRVQLRRISVLPFLFVTSTSARIAGGVGKVERPWLIGATPIALLNFTSPRGLPQPPPRLTDNELVFLIITRPPSTTMHPICILTAPGYKKTF